MLDGMLISQDNYKVAVDLLTERYGNKRVIVKNHTQSLLNLSKVADNPVQLESFYTKVESHIRSLNALGEHTDDNPYITEIILSKLPENICVKLERGIKDLDCKEALKHVLDKLREKINMHQVTGQSRFQGTTVHTEQPHSNGLQSFDQIQSSSIRSVRPTQPNSMRKAHTSNTFDDIMTESTASMLHVRSQRHCVYCKSNHFSDQCNVYSSASERRGRLQIENRCFRCLNEGHRISECPESTACYYCKRNHHHSSICFKQFPTEIQGEQSINTVTVQDVNTNSIEDNNSKIVTELKQYFDSQLKDYIDTEIKPLVENSGVLHVSQTQIKGNVILTTVCVNAKKSNDPSVNHKCRALFDCGSQRTIVTKKFSDKLKLTPIAYDRVTIAGFAQETPTNLTMPRVRFELQLQDGTYKTFEANVSERITHPIRKVAINQENPLIQDLKSADVIFAEPLIEKTQNVEVDMLIGNDYCFDLLPVKKYKLTEDLYAIDSEFGFVFAGKMPNENTDTNNQNSNKTVEIIQSIFCEENHHVKSAEFGCKARRKIKGKSTVSSDRKRHIVHTVKQKPKRKDTRKSTETKVYETSRRKESFEVDQSYKFKFIIGILVSLLLALVLVWNIQNRYRIDDTWINSMDSNHWTNGMERFKFFGTRRRQEPSLWTDAHHKDYGSNHHQWTNGYKPQTKMKKQNTSSELWPWECCGLNLIRDLCLIVKFVFGGYVT